jgi:phospholipase C
MSNPSRRRFLQGTSAAALTASFPASIKRALALPGNHRTGTIRDVEHIVILTQENRSFDHIFGTLRGIRGFDDPRAVNLPNGNSVFKQPDTANADGFLLPFHPDDLAGVDAGLQFLNDVPHGWTDSHGAFADGRYDSWVRFKGTNALTHLTRNDIPFHYALADAFTICDGYYCSVLGPTDPNRYHLWTGFTGNNGSGNFVPPRSTAPDGPVVDNSEEGYNWSTYPERLTAAGISWKIYQDQGEGLDPAHFEGFTDQAFIGNFGDNSLLYFFQYQNALPGSPLFERARRGTMISPDGTLPDINAARNLFTQLAADVRNNSLPQVSWIPAPEGFSEHPNWPTDFGAWYVSQVLDTLTSNEESWSKTVFLLNYDENGGFFDHIVPPYPPQDRGHGLSTVDTSLEIFPGQKHADGTLKFAPGPYGLGVRVPMIAISPWSKGGFVCSQVFDHTSTIRFIEKRFGPSEPNITPWRQVVCGDLTSVFDFRRPEDRPAKLPSTAAFFPPDSARHSDPNPVPPSPQILPDQEPGMRPARALPYELDASAHVDTAHNAVIITFDNTGDAGAAFQVRSGNPSDLPRTYTLEADRSLADSFSIASPFDYDFSVSGPNGFVRQFKGGAVAGRADLDVAVSFDGRRDGEGEDEASFSLTVTNHGTSHIEVTVTSHYGDRDSVTRHLAPRHDFDLSVDLDESFGWYDLSITVEGDQGFLRRLAGHVETGEASFSDPAIGA